MEFLEKDVNLKEELEEVEDEFEMYETIQV
jgi:hypothetical protein